jgi:hypothetical protein
MLAFARGERVFDAAERGIDRADLVAAPTSGRRPCGRCRIDVRGRRDFERGAGAREEVVDVLGR